MEHQKHVLLALAETSLLFSLKGVDKNLVGGNKVILLHGEPGTGKTSLARGLAQKVSRSVLSVPCVCGGCDGVVVMMGRDDDDQPTMQGGRL